MRTTKVEFREIASGLNVPEGPIAMADGSVLVVEVLGGCLTRVRPDGAKQIVAKTGGGPNGAALGPDGHCYVCNNGGIPLVERNGTLVPDDNPDHWPPGSIQRVNLNTGAVETLYTGTPDWRLSAPNDLVFDAHGGFWFTDHGKTFTHTRERGAVFYAKADGSYIEHVISGIESPNGIGLSPDGMTLYVAETFTGHVWRFEVVRPGKLRKMEGFWSPGGTIVARAGAQMFLDSLAIDSAGNICVGTLSEGGILVLSSDGSSAEHIPLPDLLVTNICFGGPDLRTAYVTLSHSGRLIALDWPRSGLKLNYQ